MSADNASFRIDGSALESNAVFDFATKRSFSIRVRVTDRRGASFAEIFTSAIVDVPERLPRRRM